MRQSWIGWKNGIMEVTHFLNDPMFNLLFYCHIILNWEKVTSYKNWGTLLSLKSKLSGKFQGFNAIDGKLRCWKIVTRSKQQAPLGKLFSLPLPPISPVLQKCTSWTSRNGVMQIIFLTTNRNMFAEKFAKWERFFLRCGSILFSTSRELRFVNWVKFLERSCLVKWVIFFVSFCCLWDFLMTSTVKCRKL